ncbi:hypothetical protein niasHT_023919 [Heterodera trifolii]|uniref:Uncharacterized protein n=1 Tax=Heterodera trifolii TaxID=157864 RepID=A0ABD2JVC4_9BILA
MIILIGILTAKGFHKQRINGGGGGENGQFEQQKSQINSPGGKSTEKRRYAKSIEPTDGRPKKGPPADDPKSESIISRRRRRKKERTEAAGRNKFHRFLAQNRRM